MTLRVITSPSGPVVQRSDVPVEKTAGAYREHLRWDFWFACGYCHITECESAAIGFEIDHYRCESRYPELAAVYSNLMYACSECNNLKRDHPSPKAEALGFRIFKPDEDDPEDHFRVNPTDGLRIQGTTRQVGEFTEKTLRLNREALLRLRRLRQTFEDSRALMVQGTRILQNLTAEKLPTRHRYRYLEIRNDMLNAGREATERLDANLLRDLNRSELIDKEPKPRDAVERRQYLKRIQASSVPPPDRGSSRQ